MKSASPRTLSWMLGFSMLLIGVCGISYEYTFSKMASDILGNSVRQWAIIIGLMMFFMGIGADLQKYLPDRLMVDNFILLEILLGLLGGIGPTVILYTFGSFHDHFIIAHYFFICAVGLLVGIEIPLLTRVNQKTAPSLKHNLGWILKMDYIGSFIGALIWIFVLPKFFNLLEISFFLGIINVAVALFTWGFFKNWMQYPKVVPILAVAVIILLGAGILNGEKLRVSAEQKLYRDPVILTKTTPFQRIIATKKHSGELYFYINGQLQFSSFDEYIYHEFLVHPVMAAVNSRKKVLVLGGGDGLAVREILKYKDVEEITLVDIDPEMTKLASEFPELVELNKGSLKDAKVEIREPKGVSAGKKIELGLSGQGFFRRQIKDTAEVRILNLDAFLFAESFPGMYDVIILDFPDPNHISLSKLYSLEFYTLLKSRLAFDGLMIQQSSSPVFARETFLMIGRTMKAAGYSTQPIQQNVPTFGQWGWWIAGHQNRLGLKGIPKMLNQITARENKFGEKDRDSQYGNHSQRKTAGLNSSQNKPASIANLSETTGQVEITSQTQDNSHKLPDSVRYITPELIKASQNFGKDALTTTNTDINRLLDDKAFRTYLNAWKRLQ